MEVALEKGEKQKTVLNTLNRPRKESKCGLPYDSIGRTAEESMAGENSSHKCAAVTIQLCL